MQQLEKKVQNLENENYSLKDKIQVLENENDKIKNHICFTWKIAMLVMSGSGVDGHAAHPPLLERQCAQTLGAKPATGLEAVFR